MVNWKSFELGTRKGEAEVDSLKSFINKYSFDNQINDLSHLRFQLKYYNPLVNKEKLLFDAMTNYRSLTSINSAVMLTREKIDFSKIDEIKLIKSLNHLLVGKIGFELRHVLNKEGRKDILLEIDQTDKYKFVKTKGKWNYTNPSDYILLTFCKNRIIFKDFNFYLKKRHCLKILEKTLEILNLSSKELDPYEISFSEMLKKLISLGNLKYASFVSSKVDDNPIIDLVYRKECPDITKALELFNEEGKITSFEQINKLSLVLGSSKKNLTIKIRHKIPDKEKDLKVITLDFSHTELSELDRNFLMKAELDENRIYFEEVSRDLNEEIDQLLFKKQLKNWEEGYYFKTLELLSNHNLIYLEKKGINIVVEINPEGIIELLMNALSQEGFKPKMLNTPSIYGIEERLITFELDNFGQKIIFPIFIKSPTEKMIQDLKSKWLYGISFPLFSIIKESDFRKLNSFGDFPHLTLSELISSIFEGTFPELFNKKIDEIKKKYSEERIKDSRKIISEMEVIISNKQSKEKFRDFENNIYYLQRYLFTGTQKIGAGYLPDGIRLPNKDKLIKNSLNSGVAIWDAKIWFSDFDTEEEKEKIARYILSSLKNQEIYEKGELTCDFIIGHLESNNKSLKEIFSESKKIALKKSNRHKDISKESIKRIKLIYLDFEAIKEIIHWINSKDPVILDEIKFYENLNEFIVSNEFIRKNEAEGFLKVLNESIKDKDRKIDLKSFRQIGKEIKEEFDEIPQNI